MKSASRQPATTPPDLALAAFKQVARSLIVAGDWEGLYLHFVGDSDEAWVKHDAALRVAILRREIARSAASRGRAKGTPQARAARAAQLQREDAELEERIRGMKRREKLSERAIARCCGVSRQRVSKILARSGS